MKVFIIFLGLLVGCSSDDDNERLNILPPGNFNNSGNPFVFPNPDIPSTQDPNPDPSFAATPDACYAPGVGSSNLREYYGQNRNAPFTIIGKGPGQINAPAWTSINAFPALSTSDQDAFRTDAIFRFRVIARPHPSVPAGMTDTFSDPYARLKFRMRLRTQGSSFPVAFERTIEFNDAPVNNCTTPIIVTDVPVTTEPLIAEIYDVEWDRCTRGGWVGAGNPNLSSPCTFNPVWEKNLWQIELQVVNDRTKNFP